MIKIGITGSPGFIGSHLANYLGSFPDRYEILPFEDEYFENPQQLLDFVGKADVVVHLAGVNRHDNEDFVYSRNVDLARILIRALEQSGSRPRLIFSSSSQEERDNPYGKGKKEARELLDTWAAKAGAGFAGLLIPNVFGPFGRPFYNSVVATFCHQLIRGEHPEIKTDVELGLIYIADLVRYIQSVIELEKSGAELPVPATGRMKVSEILALLTVFQTGYMHDHILPTLGSPLETGLFNTLRSFRDIRDHAVSLPLHADNRGHLVEVVKGTGGGQAYFSVTRPGITRGNHFHMRKVERFCVVQGEAVIRLRKLGFPEVIDFNVSGEKPTALDIPVFYTHNITNTGKSDLLTLFWSNELYNPQDTDTYYQEV